MKLSHESCINHNKLTHNEINHQHKSRKGADGAAKHCAADGALLEAAVAALAHSEVPAWHEHHRSRRAHAHDAEALFPANGACLCLEGCRRGSISDRIRARRAHPVAHLPSQVLRARHKIRVRVDLFLALPILVRPDTLEQLLT